jgi:hypothetical protein
MVVADKGIGNIILETDSLMLKLWRVMLID